ncbi:hypothetical protein ABFS83_01G063000 [Erythranthe nasuta]
MTRIQFLDSTLQFHNRAISFRQSQLHLRHGLTGQHAVDSDSLLSLQFLPPEIRIPPPQFHHLNSRSQLTKRALTADFWRRKSPKTLSILNFPTTTQIRIIGIRFLRFLHESSKSGF